MLEILADLSPDLVGLVFLVGLMDVWPQAQLQSPQLVLLKDQLQGGFDCLDSLLQVDLVVKAGHLVLDLIEVFSVLPVLAHAQGPQHFEEALR